MNGQIFLPSVLFSSSDVISFLVLGEWAAWYCNDHIRGQGSLEDNRRSSAFLSLGARTCQLSCRKIEGKRGYHSYLNKFSVVGVFCPN